MAKKAAQVERGYDFRLPLKLETFNALEQGLELLPERSLRLMAAYWLGSHDATILPTGELLAQLKSAMGDTRKLANVLDRLSRRSHDLLYCLKSEGGSAAFEELESVFALYEKEDLKVLLQPLLFRGIIWKLHPYGTANEHSRLTLLETCRDFLQLPSFLEDKLGIFLPLRNKEQHFALIRALGGDVKKISRGKQVISWLKTQLRNPASLRRFYEALESSDRMLLKILSLHEKGVDIQQSLYEYSLFGGENSEATHAESIKRLQKTYGLVEVKPLELDSARKNSRQLVYRLPREVSNLIRCNFKSRYQDQITPIPLFKAPDEDFALSARGKERPTLWLNFQQLLNHLVRCEVGVIRKGGMHKKNLKRILDRLDGDPMDSYHYLDFLFHYAYQRKILYPQGERWLIDLERLRYTTNETAFYRDFWAFYRNDGSWNDRDSSPLQGVLQRGDQNFVFSLRRSILRLLWDCPVGHWIEMRLFYEQLYDREVAFQFPELPTGIGDPVREMYRFMKSTMERSLTWMGIVDTTTVPTRRIDLFRLTDIGAWLLDCRAANSPFAAREEIDYLRIQPHLEIFVPAGFPLRKQLHLARFSDDSKGRILLTRASIRRGLENGLSIAEMHDFLQVHSHEALPINVAPLLKEVSEKADQIYIGGTPAQIEVSNQNVLDGLMQEKRLHPFFQERADAKRILLRNDTDLEQLIEELREAGYSPRLM